MAWGDEVDRRTSSPRYSYEPPQLRVLGSLVELTRGAGANFPDDCSLATGSVLGADPCSGQEFPPGSGLIKP
jgi:hypothetical protein